MYPYLHPHPYPYPHPHPHIHPYPHPHPYPYPYPHLHPHFLHHHIINLPVCPGSSELDNLLGGGIETGSLTGMYVLLPFYSNCSLID